MEEPAFLIPMQRVIGRIQIQHYLCQRSPLAVQKQIHQKVVDHPAIGANLLVTIILRRRRITQLQAVQGAGTGQGVTAVTFARALLAGHIGATTGQRQSAVVTQSVMVIEILITGRQAQHPLCDQGLEGMLDPIWIAPAKQAASLPVTSNNRFHGSSGPIRPPAPTTERRPRPSRFCSSATGWFVALYLLLPYTDNHKFHPGLSPW